MFQGIWLILCFMVGLVLGSTKLGDFWKKIEVKLVYVCKYLYTEIKEIVEY